MLGILDRTKRNEGRGGGIYYEYEIDVPIDAALSTLENLHMSGELDLESLRQNAENQGLL
ncbi:orc1/cdc6 family replication initiation protein [Natronorubrum bangense JCM 10635]|uniref:Orc1/cdc6 family replication initiation protein n=1 Tax=Natronorubrum bangense JCM 10635 TaxID=1227500 RepID=L9WBC7_9EURY|nr:orc1/cdc6 family replication initiation protein [Natronorubrum bangense JCM 10635]